MCATCHGAPGIDPSEIGEGLYPSPPDIDYMIDEFGAKELFWVTKNGIKFSGMPAFGPTHDDNELWAVVAFLVNSKDITADEYKQILKATNVSHEGHKHSHKKK